jgi:hypothetical protein
MRRVLADWPEIKSPRMTLRQHIYRRTVDVAHCRQRELRLPPERPAQRTGYRGPGAELNWAEIPTRYGFALEPAPLPSIAGLILDSQAFCSRRRPGKPHPRAFPHHGSRSTSTRSCSRTPATRGTSEPGWQPARPRACSSPRRRRPAPRCWRSDSANDRPHDGAHSQTHSFIRSSAAFSWGESRASRANRDRCTCRKGGVRQRRRWTTGPRPTRERAECEQRRPLSTAAGSLAVRRRGGSARAPGRGRRPRCRSRGSSFMRIPVTVRLHDPAPTVSR